MDRDLNFLELCNTLAKNTKCFSRKIGAVLVRNKTIVGTGYNGPPRGVPHCDERYLVDPVLQNALREKKIPIDRTRCPRQVLGFKSGEGLDWCVAGHGERNALINAARLGVKTEGCTLYMNCGVPCTPCLVEIINAGIKEIVVTKMEYYDISAEYLVKNSDLLVRVYTQLIKEEL